MTTTTLTTREARQRLFTIDAPEADALRRKLFEVVEQDEQLDIDAHGEFNGVILNWGKSRDLKEGIFSFAFFLLNHK